MFQYKKISRWKRGLKINKNLIQFNGTFNINFITVCESGKNLLWKRLKLDSIIQKNK